MLLSHAACGRSRALGPISSGHWGALYLGCSDSRMSTALSANVQQHQAECGSPSGFTPNNFCASPLQHRQSWHGRLSIDSSTNARAQLSLSLSLSCDFLIAMLPFFLSQMLLRPKCLSSRANEGSWFRPPAIVLLVATPWTPAGRSERQPAAPALTSQHRPNAAHNAAHGNAPLSSARNILRYGGCDSTSA